MISTFTDLLRLLEVQQTDDATFVGTQPDTPNHHIIGSQVAAQALMAAGRTTPGRLAHSMHMYFLRRGDARQPIQYDVTTLRDGGTISSRRVTASQSGVVLFEALASFTVGVGDVDWQRRMPNVASPDTAPGLEDLLAPYAEEFGDWWPQQRPFTMRYLDAPPRVALDLSAMPPPRLRIWLRANGEVSDDPMVNSCVVAYLSALTLLECAMTTMRTTPMGPRLSALVDHTIWFHRVADFTDWLLFDQSSPSVVGCRGLATGTLYNRSGELVCVATQEGYFAEA
ncbi:acyl-CoA thioesterase [Mycobacterium helveticum]|uniref:Acyl-CoA thioesterase 2 n=1 Tax=Mycobacterium helveticum TaxID=2592811 RepID=A0A557XP59_9MYCO|nr:acyl-CoA thioesterase domain-containing protein [Mycobacterium helveticum]TVS84742.1 acyl-CoA thioesterase II [Mycobacterium helveticum]TVS87656.1 acyl-CoA thioesterase II [Mycobacterium helveticum]